MAMYIKTDDGDWTEIGELSGNGVVFVPQPEVEIVSPPWWGAGVSIVEPQTREFEFKLSKWGYIDFMMMMLGITRKEARRLAGRKPLLKNGKAWR